MAITLGKYGLLKKMYHNLKRNGALLQHCYEPEQELKQLYETIDKQLKEKNPRPKTYGNSAL